MNATIIQFTFGFVAFNEQKKLVSKVLFPNKPQAAAKRIVEIETGKIEDVKSLISILQKAGFDEFIFENATIASEAHERLKIKTEIAKSSDVEALRARMEQVALEISFTKDEKALSVWNHNVSLELAKLKIKGASEKRDLIIAQAIQTLDDLDRTVNLFMGRLREWYGVHFPELDRLIEKHETYARLVMNLGYRDNFSFKALEKEGLPKERIENVTRVAAASMGADIAEYDLSEIRALSKNVLELYELRKRMENYVDKTMEEVAPNTRAIAGALIGARLIALAGSLRNLAVKPASTIQVLGAEKALFRSLKTGARPPKHGLIFQHNLLHDAKRWQRGKIARVLAGKLAIAVRADAFGGKFVGDALKADIEKRLKEIKEKYKEPPPEKARSPRSDQRRMKPKHREARWRDKNRRKKRSAR
jgi:nucleolar protein 56